MKPLHPWVTVMSLRSFTETVFSTVASAMPQTSSPYCKPITTAQMEDFAQLMRRLFRGEVIEMQALGGAAHPPGRQTRNLF